MLQFQDDGSCATLFAGDLHWVGTWDIEIVSLIAFIRGNIPIFFLLLSSGSYILTFSLLVS